MFKGRANLLVASVTIMMSFRFLKNLFSNKQRVSTEVDEVLLKMLELNGERYTMNVDLNRISENLLKQIPEPRSLESMAVRAAVAAAMYSQWGQAEKMYEKILLLMMKIDEKQLK